MAAYAVFNGLPDRRFQSAGHVDAQRACDGRHVGFDNNPVVLAQGLGNTVDNGH